MSVKASLRDSLEITIVAATDLGGAVTTKDKIKRTTTYISGTGANNPLQLDAYFGDERTLAGGANETLDIAGGVADFSKVKELRISLPDQTDQASAITIGGASSNGWYPFFVDSSDKLKIAKGGSVTIGLPTLAGMPVTAGSADKLKIENLDGSNNATYKIALLGNS